MRVPRQKIPLSEKDQKWRKDTVKAYIERSSFGTSSDVSRRNLVAKCYKYYNGIIDKADYTHVTNPYGESGENQGGRRRRFPAKLQNYQIIKPIVDLLLGEKSKRPVSYTVSVSNPDVDTRKEKEKKKAVEQVLKQQFVNELNNQGVQTGQPTKETKSTQEVMDAFERDYTDNRAIMGQEALNYMIPHLEIPRKFRKGWFHFLVSGEVYTLRSAGKDDPEYEVLNPLQVDYDKSPDRDFVEDGQWAVHRKLCTPSDVIDAYYDELEPSDIDQIENPDSLRDSSFLFYTDKDKGQEGTMPKHHDGRLVEVSTVYWKTLKKIGIVTYRDEMGVRQKKEVESDYELGPMENVEWFWVNEVWRGTQIDSDIYVRIRPVNIQRGTIDNPSKCKLPINGRKYSDINAENISLVMMGIPYQLTYNIYKYRLEMAVAKSKDIIGVFDVNMSPEGWDMEKWLYYLDALGIAWVDYSKEGVRLNPQHKQAMDMSVQTISQYIELLEYTVQEWERVSGVSRQRQGKVMASAGKATTEHAIIQSSAITEDYFKKFSEFEQRDLQALIDYSKYTWINGKKGMYIMPDYTQGYLSLDGIQHLEAEYGVFVTGSRQEQAKINQMKQLAQPLAQNGASMTSVADIIGAESFAKLKDKISEAEKQQQKMAQAAQKAEAEQQQAEQQFEQLKMQNQNRQNELDRQNKLDVAQIQAMNKMTVEDLKAAEEEAEREHEERARQAEQKLERDQFNQEKKEHKDEVRLREKEIAAKNNRES